MPSDAGRTGGALLAMRYLGLPASDHDLSGSLDYVLGRRAGVGRDEREW